MESHVNTEGPKDQAGNQRGKQPQDGKQDVKHKFLSDNLSPGYRHGVTFLFHFESASLVMLIKTAVVEATRARTSSALVSRKKDSPNPRTTRLTTVTRILLLAI
jgi:hypothetical protein